MAGMYDLVALGTDACGFDRSAPCRYWHLKCRVLRGEDVSQEELRFVGFTEEGPRSRDGWKHASSNLEILYHNHDRDELSTGDSATLAALMAIESVDLNRERLEFLGG